MTGDRGFRPRGLGEIALRCRDIDRMEGFYTGVIGLDPIEGGHRDGIRFLRIAEGVAGHTTVLALFAATHTEAPQSGGGSTLHHIALSLPVDEQDAAIRWFERTGQPHRVQQFGWIGWRGVFLQDPEGNSVELVAYDASFRDA